MNKALRIASRVVAITGLSVLMGFLSFNAVVENTDYAWATWAAGLVGYVAIVFVLATD